MFYSISWYDYWIMLAVFTFIYYLFVYIAFFRARVKTILSGKERKNFAFVNSDVKEGQQRPSLPDQDLNNKTNPENEEQIMHVCMDELNAFFENQRKSKGVKSEVMFALYGILQKYPSLKGSEYKESLTNIMATQCEVICSIHLNAEEIKDVWFG